MGPDLEKQFERLVNKALDYVLDLNEYPLDQRMSETTHVNIDTDTYVNQGIKHSYSVNLNLDQFSVELDHRNKADTLAESE